MGSNRVKLGQLESNRGGVVAHRVEAVVARAAVAVEAGSEALAVELQALGFLAVAALAAGGGWLREPPLLRRVRVGRAARGGSGR
eukprot:245011-Prorocentrum_minimum.AAC.1